MTLVRFAPSPTGRLHVGNARIALVNWLFAKATGGRLLLRLDDTDQERSQEAYALAIEADLAWLGLSWDLKARQSEREARYAAAVERLKSSGALYPCYETSEELAAKRAAQRAAGRPPRYDRAALHLGAAEREALERDGRRPHWRLKLPDRVIEWQDLVRGAQSFPSDSLSDPVLLREDGRTLYTLASVVDDVEMAVTHIIRGEDHVANTAAQIALIEALGGTVPTFAHLPLLVDAACKGLSKRLGSLSLEALRESGIEAMTLNALLANLGTGQPLEPLADLEALVASFEISAFGRAPARFDPEELQRLNAKLLHQLPFAAVADRLPGLDEALWQVVQGNLECFCGCRTLARGARRPARADGRGGGFPRRGRAPATAQALGPRHLVQVDQGLGRGQRPQGQAPLSAIAFGADGKALWTGDGGLATSPAPRAGGGPPKRRSTVTLQVYNTLTRRRERFEPLDPARVRMYVCGPTVYDFAHIGNARPVVAFDVLFRLLRHHYGAGQVIYARNITDVDDKIIAAADASGEPIDAVTKRTTEAFHQDMAALGALPPSIEPRATGTIAEMITLIERLIEKGHAYAAEGHVLFAVASFPDYGQLSGHNRDELLAGARVDVAPYKRDPMDFVLWKPSNEAQPGWDSPWGRGRPGWHIECSAMSWKHFGEVFDIHAGGLDLIFPHHENEIAQSRCVHGSDAMARYWMHNGYVVVDGEKMSKSLGNFLTVRELLEEGHPGEAIRLALLSGHYRQPLDITRDKLGEAKTQLDRLYGALRGREVAANGPPDELVAALDDDLNTPKALAVLHALAHRANQGEAQAAGALAAGAKLLGLLEAPPETWFQGSESDEAAEIEALIAERQEARKNKDFARADAIRDELKARGIELEDGPQGTTWRRARS